MNLPIVFYIILLLSTLIFSAFGLKCLRCTAGNTDTDAGEQCRNADKDYHLKDCPKPVAGVEYVCTLEFTTKNKGKKNEFKEIIRDCLLINELQKKGFALGVRKQENNTYNYSCKTEGCNSEVSKGHSMKHNIRFIATVVAASLLVLVM